MNMSDKTVEKLLCYLFDYISMLKEEVSSQDNLVSHLLEQNSKTNAQKEAIYDTNNTKLLDGTNYEEARCYIETNVIGYTDDLFSNLPNKGILKGVDDKRGYLIQREDGTRRYYRFIIVHINKV